VLSSLDIFHSSLVSTFNSVLQRPAKLQFNYNHVHNDFYGILTHMLSHASIGSAHCFFALGIQEFFLYPHFYLQAVQMQVHLANGVMGGEVGRGAPISTPL
jgi:hypothetical protein